MVARDRGQRGRERGSKTGQGWGPPRLSQPGRLREAVYENSSRILTIGAGHFTPASGPKFSRSAADSPTPPTRPPSVPRGSTLGGRIAGGAEVVHEHHRSPAQPPKHGSEVPNQRPMRSRWGQIYLAARFRQLVLKLNIDLRQSNSCNWLPLVYKRDTAAKLHASYPETRQAVFWPNRVLPKKMVTCHI